MAVNYPAPAVRLALPKSNAESKGFEFSTSCLENERLEEGWVEKVKARKRKRKC